MTADFAALERVLSRVTWRIRARHAAVSASAAIAIGAVIAAVLRSAQDLALEPSTACLGGLALTASAAVAGACMRVSRTHVAQLIDAAGALQGRVRSAIALLEAGDVEGNAFAVAAVRDAERHACSVDPRRVTKATSPRALMVAVGGVCAWIATSSASPVPRAQRSSRPEASRPTAAATLRLEAEDLAALPAARERGELAYAALLQAARDGQRPSTLIEEAMRLETRFARELAEEEAKQVIDAVARSLGAARSNPADEDLPSVRDALTQLAERLRAREVDARDKARLAAALESARELDRQRRERTYAASDGSLLKHGTDSEPHLLKRKSESERQLETLQRPDSAERRLEQLSRSVKDARDALRNRDDAAASDALDKASEALRDAQRAREERKKTTQGDREDPRRTRELMHAVSALRELMQRRAAADKPANEQASERERRKQFEERARGGETDERAAESEASGTAGRRAVAQRSEAISVTNEPIASPGGGDHEARRGPASPRLHAPYADQALQGVQGRGPVRSEVIRGAAGAGFASEPYRRVYADYRAHAEQVVEHDDVPASARFHVRRYFDLVRPRGTGE